MKLKMLLKSLIVLMVLAMAVSSHADMTIIASDTLAPEQPNTSSADFIRELQEELERNLKGQKDQVESQPHDPEVKKLLIAMIKDNGGTLPFPDFFDASLYSPHGYYQKHIEIPGHFSTYSEKNSFAIFVKEQLYNLWGALGLPETLDIIEGGAGNGTLAKNILTEAQKDMQRDPSDVMRKMFYDALHYTFVDISKKFTNAQEQSIAGFENKVSLKKGDAFDLSALDEIENGIFLSNELVDQFAAHILRMHNGTFKEVHIKYNIIDDSFEDVLHPITNTKLKDYVDRIDVSIPEGHEIAINLNIDTWQQEIAKKIKNGFVLTFDYGGKLAECINSRGSAVWATQGQSHIYDIKKILNMPGVLDMTFNVNMRDISVAGERVGLKTIGYQPQSFLFNQVEDQLNLGVNFDKIKEWNADHSFKMLLQATAPLSNDIKVAPYFEPYEKSKENPFFGMVRLNFEVLAEEDNYIVYTVGEREPFEIKDESIFGVTTLNAMVIIEKKYGRVPYQGKITVESISQSEDGVRSVSIDTSRSSLNKLIIYDADGNELFNGKKYFEQRKDQEAEIGVTPASYDKLRRGLLFDVNDLHSQSIPEKFSLENGELKYIVYKIQPQDNEDLKALVSA